MPKLAEEISHFTADTPKYFGYRIEGIFFKQVKGSCSKFKYQEDVHSSVLSNLGFNVRDIEELKGFQIQCSHHSKADQIREIMNA